MGFEGRARHGLPHQVIERIRFDLKAPLTPALHLDAMVSHRRRRAILTAIVLYAFAALYIGYFGVNAFTGRHGLRAQQDLEQQLAAMQHELGEVKAEHALWERRVALLRTDAIDPDMLDERARALNGLTDPRDLILLLQPVR